MEISLLSNEQNIKGHFSTGLPSYLKELHILSRWAAISDQFLKCISAAIKYIYTSEMMKIAYRVTKWPGLPRLFQC